MSTAHPSSDSSSCPPWCHVDHEESPGQPVSHRSDGILVPGVERIITDRRVVEPPSVVELSVGLEQSHGETWVWFGPDRPLHRTTVLSVESAKRLVREMEKLLALIP